MPVETPGPEPLALMPVEISAPQRPQFTPANVLGNFISQVFGANTGSVSTPPAAPVPASPAPAGLFPPADIGPPLVTGSTGAAASATAGGWTVQVGAAPSEAGAKRLLSEAGANLAQLSDYRSYVQPISRDGQAFYRARFVGFSSRSDAGAMCEALKQKQISCLAMPG